MTSEILRVASRPFNSPAGRIRATGRVFEALGVFDQLLDLLPANERVAGNTLVEFARACLDPDPAKRPAAGDTRRTLVSDRTEERSQGYVMLQALADILDQATQAGADFWFSQADILVEHMDLAIYLLCIPRPDVERAFQDYYRSLGQA